MQQLRTDFRKDMRHIIRAEILPDLKKVVVLFCFIFFFLFWIRLFLHNSQLRNQRIGDGTIVPLEIVPFVNGDDPTQQPVSHGFGPSNGDFS